MRRRDDGFTLIETVAALIVLALGAGAFYRAMETGARGAQAVERDAVALALAQSRLEEAVALGPDPDLVRTGETSDGFAWNITFTPQETSQTATNASARLMRIDVRVMWRDRPGLPTRDLVLTTVSPGNAQ